MKYQIREVVDIAHALKKIDPSYTFVWENIGDPIAQNWTVPQFLKDILIEEIQRQGDKAFGYAHSRGNMDARQWVAQAVKQWCPSSSLTEDDVLFTSGLGSAIALLYQMMPDGARVLQPAPGYPTHASLESFAAGSAPLFYRLDPQNGWEPDLAHMEEQIIAHPEITAIVVINPNNPTGAVCSKETLAGIVSLAEKYALMIISDEVYFRMIYNGKAHVHMVEAVNSRVPLLVLRGMSKDVPWPGGRCGWIEFHTMQLDADAQAYAANLKQRVLMEVCSTTLPQTVLPRVYDHPDFGTWIDTYNTELEKNGNAIAETLSRTRGLTVNRADGAFYMMPLFEDDVLTNTQTLPIRNADARAFVEKEVNKPGFPLDQRFTYYLLASVGIVTVPASGFNAPHAGFRITTLERNTARRDDTYMRLSRAIETYLASSRVSSAQTA